MGNLSNDLINRSDFDNHSDTDNFIISMDNNFEGNCDMSTQGLNSKALQSNAPLNHSP